MSSFKYVEDPILGKGRAEFENGGSGGSGGSSYVGGDRINIAGGTISFVNSADIVNVTGTSVTLQPDTAYKIYATSQAITLNANPPASGKWAYEGHLEIYVAGTGYVVTGSNVVLAEALEPDAVNNCTLRFHDGVCIISVEDHVAGYIVVNGSTAGDGSLYYGISTSTNDYVAFDASLNGTTIPLAGAVAEGEKHVVGNGYDNTILTGAVDCGTSKFTVANLALSNVGITGGTMTLSDAYIPSGSTVAVSGGGLAVEKVVGEGGVIDLGGTDVIIQSNTTVQVVGCTISGGSANVTSVTKSVFYVPSRSYLNVSKCAIVDNYTKGYGNAVYVRQNASASLESCVVSGNNDNASSGACGLITQGGVLTFNGCEIYDKAQLRGGTIELKGSNMVTLIKAFSGSSGSVTITSGASINLTSSITPGGGITVLEGGCTVNGVEVTGGTYTSIVSSGGSAVVNQ